MGKIRRYFHKIGTWLVLGWLLNPASACPVNPPLHQAAYSASGKVRQEVTVRQTQLTPVAVHMNDGMIQIAPHLISGDQNPDLPPATCCFCTAFSLRSDSEIIHQRIAAQTICRGSLFLFFYIPHVFW
jgi:hypothetical protein